MQREKQRAQAESGVQQAWLAKLAAGRRLADEAIGLLERQGIYPSLQFTAMCNAAQLIEAQSRYTPEAARRRSRAGPRPNSTPRWP